MNRRDSSSELAVDTCPLKNSSKHSIHSSNGSHRTIANNRIMPQQIRKGYCPNSNRKSWTEVTATGRTWILISNWARQDWFQISRIRPRSSMGTWWRLYPWRPKMLSRTSRATGMASPSPATKPWNPRARTVQKRTATTLPFKVSPRSAIVITRDPSKHCKISRITFRRSGCHQTWRRNSGRMHRFQSFNDHLSSRTAPKEEVRISATTPKSRWKGNRRTSTIQRRPKVS